MSIWRTIASVVSKASALPGKGPAEKSAEVCGCPETLPDADPAFTSAVTALGAKLLRRDRRGPAAAFDSFTQVFPPAPSSWAQIRRFFGLAGKTTLGFEGYAESLARRYRACPKVLERVVDGLFTVAQSDGVVTGEEMAILERVASLFGLSPLSFRRIKSDHLGVKADDPYALLHVEPDAPDEAVRAAWKSAVIELHPDRAAARGAAPEGVAEAEALTKSLNAAYDAVMRERASLAQSLARQAA